MPNRNQSHCYIHVYARSSNEEPLQLQYNTVLSMCKLLSWRVCALVLFCLQLHAIIALPTTTNATATGDNGGRIVELDNFDEYKRFMNKSYQHHYDELRSRAAFEDNRVLIHEHNKRFANNETTFRMRANIMSDLTNAGYLKSFLRLIRSKHMAALDNTMEMVGAAFGGDVPAEIDWRAKGFQTVASNQLTCGSCYAFSIAVSVEGQVFKRTGKILNLSPQQIVDCSVTHGNQGCTGGSLRNTLKYLQDVGGLMRAQDYKYVSKKGKCQFVPELAVVNITSWAILPNKDESAMEMAVAHIGPIAVSINATPRTFQLYSDGIYDDDQCTSATVNHAMLIVGYTPQYWILKNWWGEKWGEQGYMRIRRGKNLCGVANYAAYAVI